MSTQERACSAVTQTGPSPNEAWHDTSTSGGGHMMWPLLIKEPNVFPTPKLRAWRGQNGVLGRWNWNSCSPEIHARGKDRTLSPSYVACPKDRAIPSIGPHTLRPDK